MGKQKKRIIYDDTNHIELTEGGKPLRIDINDLNLYSEEDVNNLTVTEDSSTYHGQLDELQRLTGGYNLNESRSDRNYNQDLALNQDFSEQLKNTAIGGSLNFAAGLLDNFNYDLVDMKDMITGKEKEYGSWLSDITSNIREQAGDFQVYQEGSSFADPAYWLNQGKNLAYSTGLISGALLEQAALSYVTAQTLGAGGGLQLASLGNKARLLGNMAFGSFKGIHEGYINGLETFNGTKQKYLNMGYSEEEAMQNASKAAALGYRMEVGPLMLLNALQFGTIGKYNPFSKASSGMNQGYSGAVESVTDVLFSGVKNKYAKGALSYGLNAASEGVEEGIQTGIGKYAEHKTLKDSKDIFTELDMFDHEMTDSIVGGVLGGLIFGGMGDVRNHLEKKKIHKNYGHKLDSFIQGANERATRNLLDLQKAIAEGDTNKADTIRYKMQKNNVYEALKLDYLNQKESAFESYVSQLKNISDAAKAKDLNKLAEYGIKDLKDIQYVQENYENYINDALNIKENFINNYTRVQDFFVAGMMADAQQVMSNASQFQKRNEDFNKAELIGNPIYENLSSDAKTVLELEMENTALWLKANKNSITKEQKERHEEINQKLKDTKLSNSEKALLHGLNKTKMINNLVENLELEDAKVLAGERIQYWNNPKNIKKEKLDRAKKKVNKAQTKEQLKEAKQDLQEEKSLTPEVEEVINDKVEEIEVSETIQNPITSFGEVVTPTESDFNMERDSIASNIEDIANSTNDAIVVDHDDLFEPLALSDMSDSKREQLRQSIENYHNNLKADLGKKPSFETFVRDFIKHSSKNSVDRLYNALVEGWKANNYKPANYNEVYNSIYKDRNNLALEFKNIAEDIIVETIDNKEQLVEKNEEIKKEIIEKSSPVVKIDENNRPILRDANPFKTMSSDLKAAHVSKEYLRTLRKEGDEIIVEEQDVSEFLHQGTDINSLKLLDPNNLNPGTILSVKIPDNYKEIKVSTWFDDYTKGPTVTFGEWERRNNIDKNSPEWLNKVPMIAYDQDNDGVFLIHDTDWYNAINIGLKTDIKEQSKIIDEGRKNVSSFRSQVNKGQNTIEITEKRLGTWTVINRDQPLLTLNEANPQTQLAIANDNGDLLLNGKDNFESGGKELLNRKEFERGHVYDIRRGPNKNEYIAFKAMTENITEDIVTTLEWAAKVYLYQLDTNSTLEDHQKIKNIRNSVINSTGLDLFLMEDFEKFLRLYIPTSSATVKSPKELAKAVQASNKVNVGSPYTSLENGALVFGIKGKKFSGKYDVLYAHPKKINDEGGTQMLKGIVSSFKQTLPSFKQHISKEGLSRNKEIITLDSEGKLKPGKKYREFLKDNLKTSVKSHNIGTKEKENYITVIQPVIKYKSTEKPFEKFVETGEVSQETVKDIADKIEENKPLTNKEEAMRQGAAEKVETELKERMSQQEQKQTYEDAYQALRELGISEADESMQFLKDQLGGEDLFEPVDISDEVVLQMKEDVSGTNGLTIIQDFQVVDFVFNEVASKLSFKYKSSINKGDLLTEVKNTYFGLIEPKKEKNDAILENLKKIYSVNPNDKLNTLINKLETEIQVFDKIKDNWGNIEDKALEKIYKYTGIQEVSTNDDVDTNDTIEKEKNYSKSSLEENGKTTASYRLKRFLSNLKQTKADGTLKNGFLGVPTYVGFDTAYSTIEQVMSSPYEMDSDFDQMIKRLEENVENYQWLQQVIDNLKEADQQIKNEFTYNFSKHTLSMKFVMFSKNRDNTYTLKVYDTNANEITRVIRQGWEANFKQSPLVFIQDGQYKINKVKAQSMLDTFNTWKSAIDNRSKDRRNKTSVNLDSAQLKDWLMDFGISISDETLNELKTKEISYTTNSGKESITFNNMFNNTNNTAGIFGLLANYLNTIILKEDTAFEENPDNHPFNNANNVLKTLSRIESKYAMYATTNSFKDNGKSIFGFTQTKHATDVVKALKFEQEFRDELGSKSFNKASYLLELLNNNEAFRDKFEIDHLGITSLKELGKKVFGDNSITSLSSSDHELTKLGLFQDVEQGEINASLGNNDFVDLRMARMFLPTMSDKSQMLDIKTAVLDLKDKHFDIEGDTVRMKTELIDILYSQLVTSELDRLTNFVSTIKSTDIKGYDLAAQMFLMIPELNNMVDETTGKRVLSLMINEPATYGKTWFETTQKDKAREIIQNLIDSEVNAKRDEWVKSGFVEINPNGSKSVKFLNSKYFDKFTGDTSLKIEIALNDYVINSLLTNANSYMLLAGDIALYSQNKIKKQFENGKVYMPKDNSVYSRIAKEIIGVNVGKRLALMLAPGNKLANSKNEEYIQLFLNDHVDITSNVETLVDMFYGEAEAKKIKDTIEKYNESNDTKVRREIADLMSAKYPEISAYFDIEATDAQEYTTLSEQVNILWKQGRLSSEEHNSIQDKVKRQLEAENKGEKIPSDAYLTYSELKVVLQPIKPLHTGFKSQDKFDVMRMMYVKSSSFPLIPQVTKGTHLDDLRRTLEKYEAKTGKFVRASYETANKVGAVTNAISPFNPDGTFNSNITDVDLDAAALTLSRDNFRIQQDVPFKSGKRVEDTVSLGTQTLKLLFGDGILDIDGMKELHEEFNTSYNTYIDLKKQDLFDSLGVDENGQPKDMETTMNMLQNLLRREAVDRGYPKQDVEALKLSPVLDSEGKVIDLQFSVPLWLSPNSNRYEALLNAIVTNKLVNIKMPGNSFVVGSEAGFKMKTDLTGVDQSKIVYTSKWQGELKAYTEGNLTQVMIPSKFRNNEGKLIDMSSPEYSYRDENGVLRLKEDKISEELLSITSFRIPTSGHVSMNQVEIVGILPVEVGDLMIVPRNLTVQKGLDFDIDKETTYQLNSYVDSQGNIKPIDEEYKENKLRGIKQKLEDSKATDEILKIFGEDALPLLQDETISIENKIKSLESKIDQKILENKIVGIHAKILGNPNKDIQRKINKVLSMDFAKGQAELIQRTLEGTVDNTYFSMLSDSYQKDKMALGASGKLGIGVYSNYVVFHSMIQQSEKDLVLQKPGKDGLEPVSIIIGRQVSDGKLGNEKSLAPPKIQRSISEIFAERQNTATDNEKEQIMGRVNINELTINVDSLMSALGFDKDLLDDGTEVSVPYLLMSQPILKEFVEEMRKTKSNTAVFDSAAKDKVIMNLKEKYGIGNYANLKEEELNAAMVVLKRNLTGQTLFNNLTEVDNNIQLAVLETFIELEDYSKKISQLQNRLNINNSGLGKSFFETVDKYYAVNNIKGDFENVIRNASSLIGDYLKKDKVRPEDYKTLKDQGYLEFPGYFVKPNNPVGAMLTNAVFSGYNLWKGYFPYNSGAIPTVTDEILKEISNESTSSQKIIELQQNVFKEMKKYFVSSQKLNVFNGTPQQERYRLFIDGEGKKSLAGYLNDLILNNEELRPLLKSNKLISRFEYDLNKDGRPSLIKFNNSKGENFDEDYLYMALIELMERKVKLPDFNGISYNTRKLAQDLVSYSYLEGGVQEAIQFIKYIPVSYLNGVGFGDNARKWNESLIPGVFNSILGKERFLKQYVQHNPQRLEKVELTDVIMPKYEGGNELINLMEFSLDPMNPTTAKYVSIYNPQIKKGLKKFQVYERVGSTYKRIPTLGAFGMAEYSVKDEHVPTIINEYFQKNNTIEAVQPKETPTNTDTFNLSGGNINEIVSNIADYNFEQFPHLKNLANAIKDYIPADLTISVDDILVNGKRVARGRYNTVDNKITVDKMYFDSASNEDIAKTVLHELIHSMTSSYVNKFVDKNGNYKTQNVPTEVASLVMLFNETKKQLAGEIEAYSKKRQAQLAGQTNEGTTERERTVAYAGTNIREFITLVMTEPNFQKEMNKVPYKQTGMTLWEKFSEIVNRILNSILGPDYDANGVTAQGVAVSLKIIENQAKESQNKSEFKQMKENDAAAESLLTGFGQVVRPTDEDFKNTDLHEPTQSGIFDEIFKCKN